MTKSDNSAAETSRFEVRQTAAHLMRRAQQIAVAIFLDEFREFSVTPMQYAALATIRNHPGIDQRTLVDLIAIDRSTIGAILGGLEKRGLIRRVTPRHNLRIKQLFLAPPGEELLDRSVEKAPNITTRLLAPLSAEEGETFVSLLRRLVDGNNELSRAPLKLEP